MSHSPAYLDRSSATEQHSIVIAPSYIMGPRTGWGNLRDLARTSLCDPQLQTLGLRLGVGDHGHPVMRETHLPDLLAREIEHAVVQADQSDTEGGRMNEGGSRR